jgi:hypothetical protein
MAFFCSLVRLLVIVMSRQPFRSNVTHDRIKVEVCAFNTRSSCEKEVVRKEEVVRKKKLLSGKKLSETCQKVVQKLVGSSKH